MSHHKITALLAVLVSLAMPSTALADGHSGPYLTIARARHATERAEHGYWDQFPLARLLRFSCHRRSATKVICLYWVRAALAYLEGEQPTFDRIEFADRAFLTHGRARVHRGLNPLASVTLTK